MIDIFYELRFKQKWLQLNTPPIACRHQPPGTGVKFQSQVCVPNRNLFCIQDLTFALDNTAEGHVASLPLLGFEEARSFAGLPCK